MVLILVPITGKGGYHVTYVISCDINRIHVKRVQFIVRILLNHFKNFQKWNRIVHFFSNRKKCFHPIKGYINTDNKWHFSNLACKGTLKIKVCSTFK